MSRIQRIIPFNQSSYGSQVLYYSKFYDRIVGINSNGILGYLSNYPHMLLEKPFKCNKGKKIIEVGAGQGEHVKFVTEFSEYFVTDINLSRLDKTELGKINGIKIKKVNAEQTNFNDNTFDRLISTCLLSHLRNPEKAIQEWRRIVKHGGHISIYISADPSLALRIFRKLTTRRRAKKLGFDGYELFIAREHKNSAQSLIEICKYNFRMDEMKIFYKPFNIKSWYLNFICIVQIKVNKNNSFNYSV